MKDAETDKLDSEDPSRCVIWRAMLAATQKGE